MAIVKLVCQGCGANLDVMDDQRVVQCGYCGTSNQIKQTVHPQPAPSQPPPQYAPTPVQMPAQVQATQSSGPRRAVLVIVVIAVLLPLLLGGLITFIVAKATKQAFDQVGISFGGNQAGNGIQARRYHWNSARPFVADVDGDGTDDLIGTIQELGSQKLLLTAMSGSDWHTLWEVDLGRRADLPNPLLRFEPGSKLVLFELGPTLHAYDAATGAERWIASLPDKIAGVAVAGEQLWVATIDDAANHVGLSDGKLSKAEAKPGQGAKPLRDDEKYDLIPELRELDLKAKQFDDVRVEQAFCPEQDLPVAVGRRHGADTKRCANEHGLAFVVRDKGTQVPFLIGYERESKAERWRVQLTKPGSLETVDGGFGQPRAEIIGDDAIVSFTPADNNARIRRISLVDGKTKWETTLTRTSTEHVEGMVAGQNIVFVTYGQGIRALSLADGQELAKLGGL